MPLQDSQGVENLEVFIYPRTNLIHMAQKSAKSEETSKAEALQQKSEETSSRSITTQALQQNQRPPLGDLRLH